jgi:hypothetical protein
MVELYFPLFDFLKGKVSQETFRENIVLLSSKFHELYQLGYCKWISLALLKLFKSKIVGTFNMPFDTRSQRRGRLIKDRPHYFVVNFIEFNSHKPFAVPDFAAYSPKLKCYLAVKTEMQKGSAKFVGNPYPSEMRKMEIC